MTFSLLKTFATFFLMYRQLQKHEINLILRVSIETFYSKLCCELQRYEIISIQVLFTNKTILKKLIELYFTPIKIFLDEFISKISLKFFFF